MEQRYIDLYNRYIHGGIERREFVQSLATMSGGVAAATALLPFLENDMAKAETLPENDPRIVTETVSVPGVSGLSGYLVRPKAAGKHPAVLVIHENRGLNPHIKDVTRRIGAAGYVALGLDYLSPLGGTPEDSDKATAMFRDLKPEDALASGVAALAYLRGRPDSTGKVGAIGFCWGGGAVNNLAVADPKLNAGVSYYGAQPPADKVASIRAPLMLQFGALDERINAGWPAYEAALKAAGKSYEAFVYAGANHGFNNDTNAARYDKATADLAWGRSMAFFKKYLA